MERKISSSQTIKNLGIFLEDRESIAIIEGDGGLNLGLGFYYAIRNIVEYEEPVRKPIVLEEFRKKEVIRTPYAICILGGRC